MLSVAKSFSENVRAFFSGAGQEALPSRLATKRKREFVEEDDPDVQIIKVEQKRRKVEKSVFDYFKNSASMMTSWMKPKTKQDENLIHQSENVASWATVSSHRIGVGRRSTHNGEGRPCKNHKPRDTGHNGLPHGDSGRIIPIQRQSSRSSNSSIFGRHHQSTASACIRLKEREEYHRLLQLQTQRLRAPWQTKVVEHEPQRLAHKRRDSDVISVSSNSNDSTTLLGSSKIMNLLPNEFHNKRKNYEHFSMPHISHVEQSRRSLTPSFPVYTPAPIPSSSIKSDYNNSNRQSIFFKHHIDLSRDSYLRSKISRQRSSALKNTNQSSNGTSHSLQDVIVLNPDKVDNDLVVIEDEPETNTNSRTSPAIVIPEDDEETGARQSNSNNQSRCPDFLNSRYLKDSFLEDLHAGNKTQTIEERKRQIQEQDLKAKAYAEKRRIQERSLEKEMKYKMKIFDEEPEVTEEIFIESDEEDEETLPELTSEMEQRIASALRPGPPGQVLSEGFRLQITRRDIATLGGLNWLNDEIINFYMNMLIERGEREGNLKVYAFNTFFYPKIMSGGHQAVRRWTKKVDIFAMNYILIPVHLGMHWCLCIANMQDKKVSYYDSMGGRNHACLEAVRKYINDESVAKKQTTINPGDWELVIEQDIPQQMNGSDCGMFTCKYAEYITRGKQITFTQEDMPYFRRRMVYEILTKELMQ